MIKEQIKNGKSTWMFRAKYRGREKSGSGFASAREAITAEKKAKNKLIQEVALEHTVGIKWKALNAKWELGIREGIGLDRPLGLATRQDYVRALELFTDHWMERSVHSITRYDVQQVLLGMAEQGLSNSRRRAVLNAINHIYRWGADHGILGPGVHSPAMGIHIRREEERKPDILTINEIRSLLKAAKDLNHEWYAIWAMALHTGARSGELFALEWNDVDLENKRLFVTKSYNRRFRTIKTTKGGYWREIPINSELEGLLKELKLKAGNAKHVLPRFTEWERGESARVLRAFCLGIGISSVKFHALRACFATQLLRDGIAPIVVMKIGGWKDMKTMQRYIRLAGIEIEGATEGLKILPPAETMGRVVNLFGSGQHPPTGG